MLLTILQLALLAIQHILTFQFRVQSTKDNLKLKSKLDLFNDPNELIKNKVVLFAMDALISR